MVRAQDRRHPAARVQARPEVRLYSRNRLPQHLPALAAAIAALPADELILDGEMAWDGSSTYHVFDILWLNGRNVTALPLEERRALLHSLPFGRRCATSSCSTTEPPWERARREGWEGVIAKRRGTPYEHRRSKHWLKMKCEASQEFVVGGFTDPQGARVGLGALLVGYYDGQDLVFAGKVGTGFDRSRPPATSARAWIARPCPRRRSRAPAGCRSSARTGCVRRSSCRWRFSSGRCTASCGTRVCSGSAPTRARARSCGSTVITHPEKILFPDDGITKGDVAAYYEALAPVMLPHLRGRPITMERYPVGIGEKGFWQKDVSRGFPAWLQRVEVPKKDGVVHHPLVNDTRSLLWITNQNTITQHVWTSRMPRLDHPDICVFDLDPSAADSADVPRGRDRAARSPRRAVIAVVGQDLGVEGLPRRRPAQRAAHIGHVAAFAHDVGALLVRRAADRLTQEFSKAARADASTWTRAERLRRDVRGGLHASARGAARRSPRPARGRRSNGATCTRGLHATQPARTYRGGRRLVGRPAAPRAIAPAAPREAAPADWRRAETAEP